MQKVKTFKGYSNGVNLGGWLSQCVSYEKSHFDNFIIEEDIARIKDMGYDHVRLPIDYDVFETEDGSEIEDGHRHIEDCIGWCRKYGLNMVLDLHKTSGFMFDTDVVPDPDKFFTDEALQNRFYEIWERLIKRYGRHKDIMAFELLNEVLNPDFKDKWNEIAAHAVKVIRKYAEDAYILIGGMCNNSISYVKYLNDPADEYIVYNFHCYEPLCFTHQRAHWVKNSDFVLPYPASIELYREKSLQLNPLQAGCIFSDKLKEIGPELFEILFEEAVEYANEKGVPLYCGEYGVIDQAAKEDADRWLADINKVFEKYGIGRARWNYKEKDFSII